MIYGGPNFIEVQYRQLAAPCDGWHVRAYRPWYYIELGAAL